MKKWEYHVEIINHNPKFNRLQWVDGTPGMLNLLGASGWELVCVAQEEWNPQTELYESQEFYFKKETDIDLEGRFELMKQKEELSWKSPYERMMIMAEQQKQAELEEE
mgnify:CR=1 FL=1|tara:strand:- start:136 stop:459 length:324 start_codon:yes stop_codon:yes gene_type:complete